jgi:hypothetical protein
VLTYEIRQTDKGPEFAACGEIWNPRHTDIYCGGQCVDEVASYFPHHNKAQRLVEIWKQWHLNGLNPDCTHQRKNWNNAKEIVLTQYQPKWEIYFGYKGYQSLHPQHSELTRIKKLGFEKDDTFQWKTVLDERTEELNKLVDEGKFLRREERKKSGWVYPSEHPDGLLTKPCEVCGYKYGSAWVYEPLPQEIINEVKNWTVAA